MFDVGWKPGRPGGKPPRKMQTYNPSAIFLLTRLRRWLWLCWILSSSSHLKAQLETWKYCWSNNSKYCHYWCSPIVVETNALQCGEHSHLCVFFSQSSEVKLLVKFVFSRRQEDTLHQKVDRALIRSSPAFQILFRNQVFFDNDPSSATSLRSATRKWVKDGWLWGFLDQEDPEVTNTNHARPGGQLGPVLELTRLTTRGDWGPVLELAQPPRLLSSAARSSVSTILLLQPVFCLRPASRPDPEGQPARYYSGGVQWWNTVRPTDQSALERVDWGDTPSGRCGGTGVLLATPGHSGPHSRQLITLRNWWDFKKNILWLETAKVSARMGAVQLAPESLQS